MHFHLNRFDDYERSIRAAVDGDAKQDEDEENPRIPGERVSKRLLRKRGAARWSDDDEADKKANDDEDDDKKSVDSEFMPDEGRGKPDADEEEEEEDDEDGNKERKRSKRGAKESDEEFQVRSWRRF